MLLLWAANASSQELTASQAIQLLRENFQHKDGQASLAVKRTSVLHTPANTGPTLSVSMEGAGRTDLYGIEQEIPVFGPNKLLRRARESKVAAERAEASHRERQTEARMLEAFYQLIHAQERKKAMGRGIFEIEEVVRSLRKFHASGKRLDLDVFPAQHALAELEISEAESEIAIMEQRSLLSGLLGERVAPDTLHASGTLNPRYELPSLREALVEALATRQDFQAAAARLEQSKIEAEAATHWSLPNPRILGGIKRADLGDRYAIGPFFAVSIPIPMSGRRQELKLSVSEEESRRRKHLNLLRHRILADVRAAHHTLRIRRKIVEDYLSQSPGRADEVYENALIAYRAGKMNSANLLGSIRMKLDTALRLLELRAASKLAEVEFDRISGREAL